ncbi:RNA helicase like protein [Babesia gibsoni]|uniref:RNA helicase n=1 Tax=Babesia gibsoni TaxID=33632 RepID=A0AAD8LGP6_BABGI|nr:RNA helicase like protein [Babesia gibsoni]
MDDVFAKLASFADIKRSNKSLKLREKVSFDQELSVVDSHGDTLEVAHQLATFTDMSTLKLKSNNLDWLIESLSTRLGHEAPSPVQRSVIPFAVEGRDIVAVAPTGSGKTLAYLIPILLSHEKSDGIQSLILVPTFELVNQVKKELVYLVGNHDVGILPLERGCTSFNAQICISTPSTMLSILKKHKDVISKLKLLVVDEADVLFNGGYAKDFDHILAALINVPGLQKMMFSSTMQQKVVNMASSFMPSAVHVTVGKKNHTCKNVKQELICVTNENGKVPALKQLIREGKVDLPCLVFLQSVDRVKKLYGQLKEENLLVERYTGKLDPRQREELIEKFRLSKIWVLLCTDILARGVDFRGIGSVVNFDIPLTSQDYINRIGRSGRGETSGSAFTLFTLEDIEILKPVVEIMHASNQNVPEYLLNRGSQRPNVKRPPKRQINTFVKSKKKRRKQKSNEHN